MKPYVPCNCDFCQRLQMSRTKQYEAPDDVPTQLDVRTPRFDVGGNPVTGELDCEKTPESGINIPIIEIVEPEPDTFDDMGGWFVTGVGIGILLFTIIYTSVLIIGGK